MTREKDETETQESAHTSTEARPEGGDRDDTMMLRFRHGVTIGNLSFAAGAKGLVPQSDEAWRVVNEGHADLEPPPGEPIGTGRQPFPPEWVQRSEATEAPAPPQTVTIALPAGSSLTPSTAAASKPRKGAVQTKSAAEELAEQKAGAEKAPPPLFAPEGDKDKPAEKVVVPPAAGGTDPLVRPGQVPPPRRGR